MSDRYLQSGSEPTKATDAPWGTPEPRAAKPGVTDAGVTDEPEATGGDPRPVHESVPTPNQGGYLPDPVVLTEKKTTTAGQVLSGIPGVVLGVVLLVAGVGAVMSEPTDGESVWFALFFILVGIVLLVKGVVKFRQLDANRSASVSIGSQGISWRLGDNGQISWDEISAVGILVGNVVTSSDVQLVLAGPELSHRFDLNGRRTPLSDPYTHAIGLPRPIWTHRPTTDLAAEALQRYAGPRYHGIGKA
ncbi:MAG: hypothetical protein FWD11_08210 [Micrococcales bacterium]|nr:hypothetical protein [Micrococcales bacterium]